MGHVIGKSHDDHMISFPIIFYLFLLFIHCTFRSSLERKYTVAFCLEIPDQYSV
jgi:hypothetical protein